MLPASDLEAIIDDVKKRLDVSVTTIRSEVKERQKSAKESKKLDIDDEIPDCKDWTGDGKRIIWTTKPDGLAKQQGRLANEVFDALCEANTKDPFLFDNDAWVTVREGTERKAIVSPDELRTILADRFDWMRVVNSKNGLRQLPVPEVPVAIAKSVENHKARHVRIPKLERVVNRPVMLKDGSFVTKRGYISISTPISCQISTFN